MISVRPTPSVFSSPSAPWAGLAPRTSGLPVGNIGLAPVRTLLRSTTPLALTLPTPGTRGVVTRASASAPAVASADARFEQSLEQNALRTLSLGEGTRFIPGESAPSVVGTQVALANLGYEIRADGVWGPASQTALDDFRAQAGLSGGGRPRASDGITLLEAYRDRVGNTERVRATQRAASTLRFGRHGPLHLDGIRGPATEGAVDQARGRPPTTRALQLALRELGYDIAVDGADGPRTRAALRAFRTSRGMDAGSGTPSAADARALFGALESHYLGRAAADLEVHHNFFGVGGRIALDVPLETLESLDAQFRETHQRASGGLLSRHYTVDELFGTGARSRPSLEALGRFGAHPELLRLVDRATDVYRDMSGEETATLHDLGVKEILSIDRGYPSRRHMDGWAVDVGRHGGMSASDRRELVEVFLRAGATSIGVYGWGVHADVDPSKLGTRWTGSGASGASLSLLPLYWGS